MTKRTIVFDLDGTLVDTAPDLIDSLNVLFAREGLTPIAIDQGRVLIGGGVKRLIERGLSLQGRTFKPADIDDLFRDYVAYYAEHVADRSRAFPGVESALARSGAGRARPPPPPAAATASRCAPISLHGCRCACSMRLGCRRDLPRSAARTLSECKSPTRRSCAALSRRQGARSRLPSWWATRRRTSWRPVRPAFRLSPSTSATPKYRWAHSNPPGSSAISTPSRGRFAS